jgi:hypothetical protein
MPETPVDEHDESTPAKHNVRLASLVKREGPVDPKAEATLVQFRPK